MADYVPTADQQRQASISNFFYYVGDILQGVDTATRIDPQFQRDDGLLGPNQNGPDLAVGQDGVLYVRGRTSPLRATTSTTATAAPAGVTMSPGLLLLLGLGYLALRK